MSERTIIVTVEATKIIKAEPNCFELDEPHHYLCPVCRNIVNLNQDYCEDCGQKIYWE